MKNRTLCVALGTLLMATNAFAQRGGAPPAAQTVGLNLALTRAYATIKLNLTEAADKLSAEDYSYRPSPEIRPFGGQFGHVSNFHYMFCSAIRGEANPNGRNLEMRTTKAEFVQDLSDSFNYCDVAFAMVNDDNQLGFVRQGQNDVARAAILANLIAHDNEEYGVITVYLRTKALVPPSTERAQRGRGAPAPAAAPAGRGQ